MNTFGRNNCIATIFATEVGKKRVHNITQAMLVFSLEWVELYHNKAFLVVIQTKLKNFRKPVPKSRKIGLNLLTFSLISSE